MKLVYAAEDFQRERASWPPIIHYNILRQVVRIVSLLEEAIHEQNGQETRPSTSSEASTSVTSTGRRQSLDNRFTTEHQGLCLRLKPLVDVEATMTKHLLQSIHRRAGEEVCVHSYFSWRKYFHPSHDPEYNARNSRTVGDSLKTEVSRVLNNSCGYVLRLWNDPAVRKLLQSQAIQLEHEAGFFLDDLERVTALDYEPTDLDVCKARLRTVGVSETHLKVRTGFSHSDWVVYDVGGSRTQRASWKSFFDDVNAIVFLAPLSAFNQKLEENPRVNRLEDSLLMWRDISSSPLLSRAHLILFLNKIDLLRKKLEQGVEFNAFLTGYTGSNDS
ncbi:G-alpha-domain-containing protein, partial [Serendipita vermifera]